jgi:hypothetical protein
VRATWRRTLAITCAIGVSTLAACGGGGGQLAERGPTSSTTTSAPNAPVPTSELDAPRRADAVARELREVEQGLRGEDRDASRLADLGRRQDLAYRALAARPEWVDRVVRRVPSDLREVVLDNVGAAAELAALTRGGGTLPTALPDWQVLPPRDAPVLRRYYEEAQAVTGTPWEYLAAIHLVETRMGRIRGTSTAGAQGPMQFIPETWETYGAGDIHDDRDAIRAAARYLADRGAPRLMPQALFSYNNDNRYVAAIEHYARVLRSDPRAYDGYHAWQVFFVTDRETYLLPEGYGTRL